MKPPIELSPKFKPLITESSRYNLISGGRGSSKSFSASTYLLLKTFEKNQVILFSRYTMTSARLSVIPEFLEKIEILSSKIEGIENLFEITATEIINKVTGSKIIFRGIKTGAKIQTANLKSIAGLTIWVLDEAEELVDENLFDDIARSIRKKGVENKILLIFNPPTDKHWLYNRFYLSKGVIPSNNITKGNTTYIHTTYEDNIEHLNKDFVEEAEEMKLNDKKKWDRIYGGAFRKAAEGLIFDYKLKEFPKDVDYEFANDFGYSNDPNALIKCFINFKEKQIYLKQELYQKELAPSDLGRLVSNITGKKLVVCDSASPDMIAELEKCGVNAKPVKKPKVNDRINLMKDFEIFVDPDSEDLINEFNNYCWDKNYPKGERPIDDWNHCFVGDTQINTIKGEIPIKNIKQGDEVLTRKGYKKVLKKFNNGVRKVNKYVLSLDNGDIIEITSTPDHKIKTNKGWIKIKELQKNQIVLTSKSSIIKNTTYMKVKDIIVKVRKDCIEWFGNTIMEKFQKGITYITLMVTPTTTKLKTSTLYKKIYTCVMKVKKGLKTIKNGLKISIKQGLKKLKNGINQKKEINGTQNTQKNNLEKENQKNINVSVVEKSMKQNHIQITNSVVKNVIQNGEETQELMMNKENVLFVNQSSQQINIEKRKLVDVNVVQSYEEEVFDFMVEDEHEYFANNLLVHNCMDAWGYYVTEKKRQPKKRKKYSIY